MQDESYFELSLSAEDQADIAKTVPSKDHYCPHFLKCGGCQLLNWDYEKQVSWKADQLVLLSREMSLVPEPFLKAQEIFAYRHKNTLTLKAYKSQIEGGFYALNSKDLINVNHCLIQDKQAEVIFNDLKTILRQQKQMIYDPKTGEGFLRHVVVRVSEATKEVMVILVNTKAELPGRKNIVNALRQGHPEITSIIENTNPKVGPYVLSNTNTVLFGRETITETIASKRFRMGPSSFFQVHPKQAERLFETALGALDLRKTDTLTDLYCGVGVLALMASDKVKSVIGVESNPVAIKFAQDNAKLNGISNARFHKKDVDAYMAQAEPSDLVVMDPPREGASLTFIQALIKMAPRQILYISCNPITLIRDLKQLSASYKVTKIQGADLFPHTKHIEAYAVLTRKTGAR